MSATIPTLNEVNQANKGTGAGTGQTTYGPLYSIEVEMAAGGTTGTADDVDVFATAAFNGTGSANRAPFGFDIVDIFANINNAVGASTLQARTAAAAGGTALGGALSSGSAGIVRNANSSYQASQSIAKGGQLFIRRSDRAVTGIVTFIVRVTDF